MSFLKLPRTTAQEACRLLSIAAFCLLFGLGTARSQTDQPVLKITPVAPAVIYPSGLPEEHRLSALIVLCDNFREIQLTPEIKDIEVFLSQTKVPNIMWSAPPQPPDKPEAHQAYATLDPSAKQLDLWIPWPDYSGKLQIQVAVNGKFSKPYDIIVAGVDWRWTPVLYAAGVSLVILLAPIALIRIGRVRYRVDQRQYGVLRALFLDKETDTYSLSKFQFYAWTAAGVFGYILLTLAQSLVQGRFIFADIPKNLPGIILISAATTATSQGITATKGAKGAGDIYPSVADFVTTGGLVVAERFQFFVWTIVGVFTFLFLVIFSDPANITDLPKIPDGFLALMGISSFGYLGGKLARKPGPIIDEIAASVGSLIVEIRGRKLSRTASFKIDGSDVKVTDTTITGADADDDGQSPDVFKTLTLKIADPDPNWQSVGVKHDFRIINPDAQEAEWFYTMLSKPVIPSVIAQTIDQNLVLTIIGQELSKDATFKIGQDDVKPVNVTVTPGDPDDHASGLFKTLTVTIRRPQSVWQKTGAGLTLTNPDSQQATSASYTFQSTTLQSPPFQSPP
jgi:hypothetical protein